MSSFDKSQLRKKTKRKMRATSRTIKVTTMRKTAVPTRCRCTVCVSGDG